MKFRILLGIAIGAVLVLFLAHQGRRALHAARPADMPESSRFVQTGFDVANNEPLGQWVACRASPEQATDWCRVADQRGTVVFEGQFLPVDSGVAVGGDPIRLGELDKDRMWTFGPAELAPVPVIRLEDGQTLVPAADRVALITRWAKDPDESGRFLGGKR